LKLSCVAKSYVKSFNYRQDASSGKLPVLFLFRGRKSSFSPRRSDSLHRFTWNLTRARYAGPLGRAKFHANRRMGCIEGPKSWIFPHFGRNSPSRGELRGDL